MKKLKKFLKQLKKLQEFYNEFINTVNLSIKQFVFLIKQHRRTKIHLSNIKRMLIEHVKLFKECNQDKPMIKNTEVYQISIKKQ